MTGLTVGQLAQWAAQHDPDLELVLAFRDGNGVVWRFAHELWFDLFADAWFDAPGAEGAGRAPRPLPCIEIDIEGEFSLDV